MRERKRARRSNEEDPLIGAVLNYCDRGGQKFLPFFKKSRAEKLEVPKCSFLRMRGNNTLLCSKDEKLSEKRRCTFFSNHAVVAISSSFSANTATTFSKG